MHTVSQQHYRTTSRFQHTYSSTPKLAASLLFNPTASSERQTPADASKWTKRPNCAHYHIVYTAVVAYISYASSVDWSRIPGIWDTVSALTQTRCVVHRLREACRTGRYLNDRDNTRQKHTYTYTYTAEAVAAAAGKPVPDRTNATFLQRDTHAQTF